MRICALGGLGRGLSDLLGDERGMSTGSTILTQYEGPIETRRSYCGEILTSTGKLGRVESRTVTGVRVFQRFLGTNA
jgi:hypothetical protein